MSESSKRFLLRAIAMGLLTIVITPLMTLGILLPETIRDLFNPLIVLSHVLEWKSLNDSSILRLCIQVFVALLGDLATAYASFRIFGGKKYAIITFFSALGVQCLLAAVNFFAFNQ